MADDLDFDAEWARFVRRTRKNMVPKMKESAYVMSLVPEGPDQVDIKFAVELGMAIMLDKPLLLVVTPDTHVPARLRALADSVIEVTDMDTKAGAESLVAQLPEALQQLNLPEDEK